MLNPYIELIYKIFNNALNIQIETCLEKCGMSSAQANVLPSLDTPEVEGCGLVSLQPTILNTK